MVAKLSVLLFVLCCHCYCGQRIKVGDIASSVLACRQIYMTKIGCPDNYEPVCAVADKGLYLNASNDCEFCVQYGNLAALIVQMGTSGEFKCAPFEIFTRAMDDPYCKYIKTSGQQSCTRESNPICGTMDDKPFNGANKCEFCKQYGDTKVVVVTIGSPCTQLKVGDVVRDNLGCRKMACTKSACTLEYNPVCAYDFKTFMNGSNVCDFCQKNGNSTGVIVKMGVPAGQSEFICKPLSEGMRAKDAPHCEYVCKTWQKPCTMPPKTVCGELNGNVVSAISTCEFCKAYGCTEATVVSIGKTCAS